MKATATYSHQPWNKGKLVGQKAPLRLRDIWFIRVRLQIADRPRDLALFEFAVDSKLRVCDLTKLRVRDIAHGDFVSSRAIVMQQKTQRPMQFEITEQTRVALAVWIQQANLRSEDFFLAGCITQIIFLSDSTLGSSKSGWLPLGLIRPCMVLTRCVTTKASLIYRRTKNLRAIQFLLGHSKLESTVRYLGIEVDDALEMAEQTEV